MVTKVPGRMVSANTILTTNLAREGVADQVLTSNGVAADPAYETAVTTAVVDSLISSGAQRLGTVAPRQCVIFGPVTSTGAPDFIPASAAGLILTTQNLTTTPLILSIANGLSNYNATCPFNLQWTTLTPSATNYLYLEWTGTSVVTGSTTVAPNYVLNATYSTSNLQHTFSVAEMVMKVGNGAVAFQASRVFVGEAITSGSAVTSTIAYAYCGRYFSPQTSIAATATPTTFNHNIGIVPRTYQLQIQCISANVGYAIGDITLPLNDNASNNQLQMGAITGRNTAVSIFNGSIVVANKSTGALTSITTASWRYLFIADRGW